MYSRADIKTVEAAQSGLSMADWGKRLDIATWVALAAATVSWVVALTGVACIQKVYKEAGISAQVHRPLRTRGSATPRAWPQI